MTPRRVLAVVLLLLAACGGGKSDSVQSVCEAQCDRELRCQANSGETRDACIAGCTGGAPSASIFKPGVLATWAACLDKLACSVNDDQCLLEVVTAQNPNPSQDPKLQACQARHDECANANGGVSFSDDQCVAYFLCTAQVTAAMDACLAGACETISACLDGVLQW
jgi:hypothetical protein